MADLFDAWHRAALEMHGFLERIVYLSAVSNHRRTARFLVTTPDTRAGIRAQREGRQLSAEPNACSVDHEDLGQPLIAVLYYAYQESSLSPTALGREALRQQGPREDTMGSEGLTRRTVLRSAALVTTALAGPLVRNAY